MKFDPVWGRSPLALSITFKSVTINQELLQSNAGSRSLQLGNRMGLRLVCFVERPLLYPIDSTRIVYPCSCIDATPRSRARPGDTLDIICIYVRESSGRGGRSLNVADKWWGKRSREASGLQIPQA